MNQEAKSRLYTTTLIGVAVLLLFALALSSCAAAKEYQAQVSSKDVFAAFRVNGDHVVLAKAQADVAVKQDGAVIWAQSFPADVARVRLKDAGIDWHGKSGDALPAEARPWFTDSEIAAYGLTFQPVKP